MKILAVDTATKSCSVAVIDNDALLAESTLMEDETHSRHLLSLVDAVMVKAELKLAQLDGFAVCVGPGSFTGLRIGIASIKGLAYALNKPVVGVSSLKTLAWQCQKTSYLICPLIDARKQQVFFGRYRYQNEALRIDGREQVASPAEAVRGIREPSVFIGNGAELYRDHILSELGELAHFVSGQQQIIQASAIARLSLSRFINQETDDVHSLVPHYIRRPDAELKQRAFNPLKS